MAETKILFMGTPDFAVPSLAALIRGGRNVAGVVTQPDRPKGRGRQAAPPPVKAPALDRGIAVYQPERVRDAAFLEVFRGIAPDLVVVAAFGQILPKEILARPKFGCINVHPSLLPRSRGAAPIQWTLIRGETRTGVTIMQMDEGVDSGDILLQEETPILPEEDFGALHDRLALAGAELLIRAVEAIEAGKAVRTAQDPAGATFAPRLKKEDGLIRWEKSCREILNLIRGLSPVPGAYTCLNGKVLKIFSAAVSERRHGEAPGTAGVLPEGELAVAAGDGYVLLRDVQLENKNRMPVRDFLRGCRLAPGTRLGGEA
ncbi:MAG TPA: methionyl-tRNA formyltransferase [Syntrophales bacterium]|nr:methionyl-tRNA formyltransferase [Syntrophales bacterium]